MLALTRVLSQLWLLPIPCTTKRVHDSIQVHRPSTKRQYRMNSGRKPDGGRSNSSIEAEYMQLGTCHMTQQYLNTYAQKYLYTIDTAHHLPSIDDVSCKLQRSNSVKSSAQRLTRIPRLTPRTQL